MSANGPDRAETRRRLVGITAGAVIGAALLAFLVTGLETPGSSGATPIADLIRGDCFTYPGDGVTPTRVDAVSCSAVHYGEVYATVTPTSTDNCVPLFEGYTGIEDYWSTHYLIGFLEVDAARTHCYLYAAEDLNGSLAG